MATRGQSRKMMVKRERNAIKKARTDAKKGVQGAAQRLAHFATKLGSGKPPEKPGPVAKAKA
jgi:hypothetical protein